MSVTEKMFGSCNTKATGTYRPDPKLMLSPPGLPNMITRIFCTGCGAAWEAPEEGARLFAKKCQNKITLPFEHGFFMTGGCLICDGDQSKLEFVSLASLKS